MNPDPFPRAAARVIGEVIGEHYYSHRRIEAKMYEAGFSGEVPVGNCSDTINAWILREAQQHPHEIHKRVGAFIEEFLDCDWSCNPKNQAEQARIQAVFAKNALSYTQGGHLFGGAVSEPSKSLNDHLKTRNIPEIESQPSHRKQLGEKVVMDGLLGTCHSAGCEKTKTHPPIGIEIQRFAAALQPHSNPPCADAGEGDRRG